MNYQLKNMLMIRQERAVFLGLPKLEKFFFKFIFGNAEYDVAKYDRKQIVYRTVIKYRRRSGVFLQQWTIKCGDKKINGKTQKFSKSSKTSTPTPNTGATVLSPIGFYEHKVKW